MANYKLSNSAKQDLIRIHQFGADKFGMDQADKYYNSFFTYFDIIAQRPYSFEAIEFVIKGYRRCVCGADSIYYKINDDMIEIMAVIGRQDLNNLP